MTGRKIVALAGGVGGAKLALGLAGVLPGDELTVAVNTADDFEHLGLYICPDLDTVMYTLGGLANPEPGWGRRNETWNVLEAIGSVGGETWFRLGDKDLATHIERTRRLRGGEPLSSIIADFAKRFGIQAEIVPMCDEPVRTVVKTDGGDLPFQDWFVRLHCEPVVRAVRFAGVETAKPHPALRSFDGLRGVIFCPSPRCWLSWATTFRPSGWRNTISGWSMASCSMPRMPHLRRKSSGWASRSRSQTP